MEHARFHRPPPDLRPFMNGHGGSSRSSETPHGCLVARSVALLDLIARRSGSPCHVRGGGDVGRGRILAPPCWHCPVLCVHGTCTLSYTISSWSTGLCDREKLRDTLSCVLPRADIRPDRLQQQPLSNRYEEIVICNLGRARFRTVRGSPDSYNRWTGGLSRGSSNPLAGHCFEIPRKSINYIDRGPYGLCDW